MSVFISYSSEDAATAQTLAAHLIKRRTHVWIDRWEIRVGDSLLDKIQGALSGASAVLILLSRASVASEWCRRELNAGLMRELEEKRVLVIPVLLETCDIPMFLREKRYADLRTDFARGVSEIVTALAPITNDSRSRVERPAGYFDWSLDSGQDDNGHLRLSLTVVEQRTGLKSTILTIISVEGNDRATARYSLYHSAGLAWIGRQVVIESLALALKEQSLHAVTADTSPGTIEFGVHDEKTGIFYDCFVTTRVIGEDDGNDVVVDVLGQLEGAVRHMKEVARPLTTEEQAALVKIVRTPFGRPVKR
jgi:hypothetical protein